MIGYIYAIKSRNYIKIGRTVDLTARFCALQNAHPERLALYDAWLVQRYSLEQIEKIAHRLAGQIRVRNEWFHALPEIIVPAIQEAAKNYEVAPYRLSLVADLPELERHISVTMVHFPTGKSLSNALQIKDSS